MQLGSCLLAHISIVRIILFPIKTVSLNLFKQKLNFAVSWSNRSLRIAASGAMSILARGSSFLLFAVAAPVVLRANDVQTFGLWIFISTLAQITSFSDLGLGNGLVNRLSGLNSDADTRTMRGLISTCMGLVFLSQAAILAGAVVWMLVTGGCGAASGARCAYAPDFGLAVVLFLVFLGAGAVAGISQKVHIAQQRHYRNNSLIIASNLVSLLAFAIPAIPKDHLWLCVTATAAPSAVIAILDALFFFNLERRDLRPSIGLIDSAVFKSLFHSGWRFLLLQLMALVAFAGDSFLVGAFLGASQLAIFGSIARLTSGLSVIQHFSTSSWAAFSEAIARGDMEWARRAFVRLLKAALMLSISGAVAMIAVGPIILSQWLGDSFVPTTSMLFGFAAWLIVTSVCSVISSLMNSPTFLNQQFIIYSATFVIALIGKAISIHYEVASGVIWSSVVAFGLVFIIPSLRVIWKGLSA